MRVGIAGVGFMGTTHAAGWAAAGGDGLPKPELIGLVAETVEEAGPLATETRAEVYPQLADMLPDVDVVDICTPTQLHYGMVLQAAAAGKQIICEKPLARTVAEGRLMIQACQDAGVRLLVAHVVRFFPEYAQARTAVAEGQIGRPGVLRLHRGSYRPKKPVGNWFLDESKSGGILMDLMIHDYDYARWIAGDVQTVYARRVTTHHPQAPIDYGLVILTHKTGAMSHTAGAWAYPPPTFRTRFELAGDAGLVEFDSDASAPIHNLILRDGQGSAPDVALPASPVSESPYTTQIKEFYTCLLEDRPCRITAGDGLVAVQIAEAAIQSAASGQPEQLETLPEVLL